MTSQLHIEVAGAESLSPARSAALLALCNEAYEEDLAQLFATFERPVHVLAYRGVALVSHAMWVTRWLQAGTLPLLRTAYVEMVATAPAHQGQGFGTTVMQRLAAEIRDFDLGGLATGSPGFYARLGWEPWRGPLSIRTETGILPTPGDSMMILRLPNTPALELAAPLSAEWRAGELW
jgi:aminoglycoside 2'-N-acetyltransferase I